ncbi:MAG: amidophosphoribosyltransferase [Tissierellia bacterium]|nr:amidophosphoribosyltransferase [Tissierellia bacterium]
MSGLYGLFSKDKTVNAFSNLYFGLFALQHRGQEAMGLSLLKNGRLSEIKGYHLVSENINMENATDLEGPVGLGHVKYAFSQEKKEALPMPWYYEIHGKPSLIVVDGVFLNEDFRMDTLVEKLAGNEEELKEYISHLRGAYGIIFLQEDRMIAIRDIYGIKPMCIGSRNNVTIASSESCGIDAVGGQLEKFLKPGEIYIATDQKDYSIFAQARGNHQCLFEMVYIARPDSIVDGVVVYDARHKMGEILYEESPVKADVVIGAPDSGMIAALGFAHKSGIYYQKAIVRNRYIGRTFITPTDEERQLGVKIKLSVIESLVRGKDVVLVDDSIVRGITMKRMVNILKEAGAKSIHIRIACPPVVESENLSIDVPDCEFLISHHHHPQELVDIIGCDSLAFLSLEGLRQACGNKGYYEKYFGGENPVR